MNSFSISQLQDYSGIKAHTIRIWEKRYNALKPIRSEGNTRYYDSVQLRRLLNIASLMKMDYKVSELCTMSDEYLNNILDFQFSKTASGKPDSEYYISQIISSAISYDELRFEKFFSNCILRFGLKATYVQIIYPVLVRLGLMWSKDSLPPGQEHFITNLIRQKFLTAVDSLPTAADTNNSWLLFLAEDEFHETGLLLAYYLIRQSGNKVIYLGANIPAESLSAAVKDITPAKLLTFLVSKKDKEKDIELIRYINKQFPEQKLYLACDPDRLPELKRSQHFIPLHSVADLETQLI